MRAVHCILIAAAWAIASPAAAQTRPIEAEMSAAERSATGIERLTDSERAALNAWLARRGAQSGTPSVDAPDVDARLAAAREAGRREALADAQEVQAAQQSREPVDSTLTGTFTGFAKGREYTLANGQVWRQTDATALPGVTVDAPSVQIRPARLGGAWLKIGDYNTRARVERVR